MTLGMVVQEPAHAELVLTASAVMIAATVALFTAVGITFVSTGDAEKAAKAFVTSSQEIHDQIQRIVDNVDSGGSPNGGNGDGSNKIKLNAACNAALATIFHGIKDFFHIGSVDKGTVSYSVPFDQMVSVQNVGMYPANLISKLSNESDADYYKRLYSMAQYSFDAYLTFNDVRIGGSSSSYKFQSLSFFLTNSDSPYGSPNRSASFCVPIVKIDGSCSTNISYSDYYYHPLNSDSYRFGFYFLDQTSSNGMYLVVPFLVGFKNGSYFDCDQRPLETFYVSPSSRSNYVQSVPYVLSGAYSFTDIYNQLRDKLATIPAPTVAPVVSPIPSAEPSPSASPSPVVAPPVEIDIENILRQIEQNQEQQIKDTQKDILIDIGIKDALDDKNADGTRTPDNPPPSSGMPDIGGIWDYVKNFLSKALIWMQLWYSGFVLLPPELQITLWALLVITIILGVLGVILR